jgi:Asp-tRNA(Asn)/Glu-tRNA(Gln) amidotransferase A subunit family amidase
VTPEEYREKDAVELASWVARGDVKPEALLDCALARRAEVDHALGSIVISMEEQARRAIAEGLPPGPLCGVPFLLKDLHAHAAGVRTTSGCRLFADYTPARDAELTARYRRAGLVLFGKTASPEFGLTTTTESTLFGVTRNPWSLEHSTGGSSGGAAAAVAAGIVPVAHASDGGGSIRIPASCCGLFGMKPTRARTPAGPTLGEGWSGMSHHHAVSRSVRDSAALLDATEGPDLGAPYWAPPPARPYLEEVGTSPGRLRIALQRSAWNGTEVHPECVAAAESAARLCEELGHEVEETELAIDAEALGSAARVIIFANLRATLDDRLTELGRALTEDDVEPTTWLILRATAGQTAAEYARAIRTIHALGRQVSTFLRDRDLVLSPTMGVPPLPLGAVSLSNPDVGSAMRQLLRTTGFTQLFNASGHPAMSVPLHWTADGLPVGVQFAGRFGDEATLFRLAAQLEEARPWRDRRPPFPAAG